MVIGSNITVMSSMIEDFINSICDLKKEEKKRPIGFVNNEEDPFYDSAVNKLLGRLGHDERLYNIPHEVKYYLESLLREDEKRYPRIRIQCHRCQSLYIFYVEPKPRYARNDIYEMMGDEENRGMSVQMVEHIYVNCTVCQSRLILTDVDKIIKFEAILTNPENPTEPPRYDFSRHRERIGDPFGI